MIAKTLIQNKWASRPLRIKLLFKVLIERLKQRFILPHVTQPLDMLCRKYGVNCGRMVLREINLMLKTQRKLSKSLSASIFISFLRLISLQSLCFSESGLIVKDMLFKALTTGLLLTLFIRWGFRI
jgi:hypothetical protein